MLTVAIQKTGPTRYALIKTDRTDLAIRLDSDNAAQELANHAQALRNKADRLMRQSALIEAALRTLETTA